MRSKNMRHRVIGIVIKNNKVLLMRRLKNGQEYYVFPGGGVEENESFEEALKREMKEELSINIENPKLLFELENQMQDQYGGHMTGYPNEHYFLIENFTGQPELGGPEKERTDDKNQYFLEWIEMENTAKIGNMPNLYPRKAVNKLMEFMRDRK